MNVWLIRLCFSLQASLQIRDQVEKGKWLINSYIKKMNRKNYPALMFTLNFDTNRF